MKFFPRPLGPGEIALAALSVAGFVSSAAANLSGNRQLSTIATLAGLGLLFAVWFVYARLRRTYFVHGYRNVMKIAEYYARDCEHTVWTARTRAGKSAIEGQYFKILVNRATDPDSPLSDIRRVMCLGSQPERRRHALWLFDQLSTQSAAEVRYFVDHENSDGGDVEPGPQFDLVVFDGRVALIALPAPGDVGVMGCIVLRDPLAVHAVETVFDGLWRRCNVLFKGNADADDTERNSQRKQFEETMKRFGSARDMSPGDKMW